MERSCYGFSWEADKQSIWPKLPLQTSFTEVPKITKYFDDIYPELRSNLEDPVGQGYYYRIQQMSLLRRQLETNRDKRAGLYKKYRRGINTIDASHTAQHTARPRMGISLWVRTS